MGDQIRVTRPAQLESLGDFHQFIQGVCRPRGVEQEAVHELKLAVDEACTNVITHGYAGMDPGPIMLALDFAPDRVVVEITDFGHPFEPAEPTQPDIQVALESEGQGGFGLYFIYQTMDEISYASGEQGNTLRFVKLLGARERP